MNKLIKLGCIALAGTLLFSCETDPEKLEIVKPYPKSDQYYAICATIRTATMKSSSAGSETGAPREPRRPTT